MNGSSARRRGCRIDFHRVRRDLMHETCPELEDVARRHGGRRARGVHVSADRVNCDRVAAVETSLRRCTRRLRPGVIQATSKDAGVGHPGVRR